MLGKSGSERRYDVTLGCRARRRCGQPAAFHTGMGNPTRAVVRLRLPVLCRTSQGEPSSPPVVTILHFDGDLGRAHSMATSTVSTWSSSTCSVVLGFCYERNDSVSVHIYPEDDSPLFQPFLVREGWQWVCGLVQPDIEDVYEELYSHFAKRPEDLHRLDWRQFETLLFRIFQAQGFVELGPGSNDGGIDVRVLQRDPLGDILTLVQAKRYAPRNKIDMSAVAALHGVADVGAAQKSIFVTTSDYLPRRGSSPLGPPSR